MLHKRVLTIPEILAWADAYHLATGRWPTLKSGPASRYESWAVVNAALQDGLRGLPGGSSLARLLTEQRGVRNVRRPPSLTEAQILTWIDQHHHRTGSWPMLTSGSILGANGESWRNIDMALRAGRRGLPGGSSLAKLLTAQRGNRNRMQLPKLTEEIILAWADLHHQHAGQWPTHKSGPVAVVPGETWKAADSALRHGRRGLPGGSSLALLLADQRIVRNIWNLPNLSIPQILEWADAWHTRTGTWPTSAAGRIPESSGDTWLALSKALRKGSRGLPGGTSLAELLAAERGVRNQAKLPPLTKKSILAWADAHFRRTGDWPVLTSGPVPESSGTTWFAIDAALRQGGRGLRGRSSLPQLLARHRGRRNIQDLPPLSIKKILAWADAHHERTGKWPNCRSGPVIDEPEENWGAINMALYRGVRGLSAGSSLRHLLERKDRIQADDQQFRVNQQQLPPQSAACSAQASAVSTCEGDAESQ